MCPSSFTSFFTGLVALLLFSTCSFSLPPPALLTLWVNSTGGADGVGCGTTSTLPCKTLNYTLQRAYEEQTDGNVTILVQANIEKESIVLLAYELGIIIQPDVGIGSVNIEECNITILSGVYFYDVNFESTNFTGWQVWFDRVTAFASTFLCNTVDSGTLEASFLSVNSSLIQNSTMASHSLSIYFCTLQNSPVSTLSCTEVCLVGDTYLRSSSFTNTLNASAVTVSPFSSTQAYVDDCTFAENSAVSGGALYVADDVMLVLSSSHVTQNSAAKGGGIYVAGSLMLKNTDVMTNIAESGGGIYVDTMGALLCADSRILDNTARAKGGGVYVDEGSSFTSINTHGCLLSGNTAQFGGGLHAQSAHIDNTYMTFISNTAHGDGGGFFATNSKVSFEGTTFMSNVAGGRGGGVACVEDCEGNFTDCAFTGNDATVDGGAVFATDSTLVIGASVRSNHAGARGGGLLAIDCLIGFAGASFTNNTASGNNSGAFASDVFLEKSSRNLKKWVLSVSGPDAIVCDDCPAFCPAANNCTDCDPTGNYCVSMDDQAMCAPTATCLHGGTCKIVTQTQVTCTCGKYRDSTDLCREYEFPIIYVYAGLGAIAGLLLLTVAITAIRLQLKKRNQYQILINE